MRLRHQAVTTIAVASAVTVTPIVGVAAADGHVVLGGGAGIVIEGSYCTLGTIGHDKTGDLVGFTAGHCGGPGAPVVAEGADNHGPVGTVAAVGDGLDYGVIKFEPAKVTSDAPPTGTRPHVQTALPTASNAAGSRASQGQGHEAQ